MRVFISHSSKNSELAEELCGSLESKGFSCFLAPRDIRSGCEYAEEIVNGIDNSEVVVLLLSEASNSSPHVLREIERAVSKKKTIIVYKLEEVTLSKSLEYFLMTHQWINAKPGRNFDEIVKRISDLDEQQSEKPRQIAAEEAKPSAPAKSDRKKLLIAVIAAAVVLAAAGAVTAFFLLNNPGKGQPDQLRTEEASHNEETHSELSSPASDTQQQSKPQEDLPSTSITTSAVTTPPTETTTPTETTPPTEAPEQTDPAVEVILPEVTETVPESDPQPVEEKQPASPELGDRITLGTYNGEPIEWRVIHISEDNTQAVVISDKILTMKAFDAAEGGSFNKCDGEDYWRTKTENIDPDIQLKIRGDNRWELSNIRTWLNSEKENVSYSGQAPVSGAMSERRNGYHTEAGFLNGFTDEELSAVARTQVSTAGTVTEDRVFLLSLDELQWLYEADVSIYAKPTAAAVEQDKSLWYKVDSSAYDTDDFFWWLREPNSNTACECWCVNMSCFEEQTISEYAGLEGFGVRPAMTLDLTSDALISILEN